MQKKQNSVAYCAVVLLLIAGIIAFVVAAVNFITKDKIAENLKAETAEKIDAIFGDNKGYTDVTAEFDVSSIKGVTAVYEVVSSTGGQNFYCIQSEAVGYGGMVEMLTGFDCDGRIVGVKVLSADGETPGLGQRITDEKFLAAFSGKLYDTPANIDGWSNSTVSSKAAVNAVNSACNAMEIILGGEEESSQ